MSAFKDRWARQRLEGALRLHWFGYYKQAHEVLHNIADVILDNKEAPSYATETPPAPERWDSVTESEERATSAFDDERYNEYLRRQFIRGEIEEQRSEPTRWSEESYSS